MSAAPRTAIVTGASSGIGAATAVELGRQGFRVAIGARRVDRLREVAASVEAAGGRAFAHFLDVSEPDSIDAFYSAAESALGPIDLLVNNAGMSILNLLPDAKVEDLRAELEVNLLGPMLFCRRAIPGCWSAGAAISSSWAARTRSARARTNPRTPPPRRGWKGSPACSRWSSTAPACARSWCGWGPRAASSARAWITPS
jgi:NAD(P)-dependent dehydrogenase (short-subunit alcohol dehydrogenase family)